MTREQDDIGAEIIRLIEQDVEDDSEARWHLSAGRAIYYDLPELDLLVRELPDGTIERVDVADDGTIITLFSHARNRDKNS
ncbi:hypothetical protein PIN31009_04670 [Pandoraea iniqua]|uniref:hypothetical protein n=1 Tax=Pandoraea iniqua TaxID=2508288 RepID=UPI0012414B93|nr:hypothetical protein [Pandoraea iniqua]VVE51278.1 hypothetical protein PIN31009_04670 [Pandoraea iniqua]